MNQPPSPTLALSIIVYGEPAPQGSKRPRPIYRGSKARGTREFTGKTAMQEMSAKVGPWRNAIAEATRREIALLTAHDRWAGPLRGPVEIRVTFAMRRGKTVRRPWPTVAPDEDKLVRSTCDGLTEGGVWADDAQVVRQFTEKVYAGTPGALEAPGAVIEIWDLSGHPAYAWCAPLSLGAADVA